ncbi:MAG: hypothetical protein AB7S44_02400 [Spirochaetales bacterium]
MRNNITIKVALLVLGIVVGAGFASGREILTFFGDYVPYYPYMLVLLSLIVVYIIYIFIRVGKFIKPKGVNDITKVVVGKFSPILDIAILFSLFDSVFAMFAGADALAAHVITGYSFPYFGILLGIIVIVVVRGGFTRILKTNSIIVPIMIALVLLVTVVFLTSGTLGTVTTTTPEGILGVGEALASIILYGSMNMLAVSILVAEMGPIIKKESTLKIGILSAILIVGCVFIVLFTLLNSSDAVFVAEMPMIVLSFGLGNVFGYLYSVVILFGILTTVIACSFALFNWVNTFIKNRFWAITAIVIAAFTISRLGFSNIVSIFYPIEGALGLVFIISVLVYYYRHRKEIKELN